ncbi:MAG: NAD(P)/FAD-dependent oxidoreductase [Eubacterium sp.]|nr:NAD(P)/FAD-dependent oxidoreductase [Eubacterium sp.]
MKKMIIIGAGAAGMMTAIHASENYDVTVIEKNEKPGKKLYITGKGRCNVTNDSDEETFLKNVITNSKFLYSSIYSYNQSRVMADFEKWGVRLKTERGNRVFPISDHSSDIIKVLSEQLKKRQVTFLYNTTVKNLITEDYISDNPKDKYERRITGVEIVSNNSSSKKLKKINADIVVLATGGNSYQATGSTGDGYKFLRDLGLDISPVRPSLVPLVTKEDVSELMGLSLKNVRVKVVAEKEHFPSLKKDKMIYDEFGEMLFTHFGVSGPLCLSASSYVSSFIFDKKHASEKTNLKLEIDLKPALSEEELEKRILRDFDEFHNKDFQNSLGKLLPRLMVAEVVKRSGIKPDKKVNEIKTEERKHLLDVLKHFTLTVTGLRGFDEAIITGGGISVKEINPQTMEIKKIKNLRVVGEIIDCDALTGGFNLQIAWSTAYMAAQ